MNEQRDKSPLPLQNFADSLLPAVPAAAKGPSGLSAASVTSDCLYQFAALTAGAFLLATML
jgi:hypothetical protein